MLGSRASWVVIRLSYTIVYDELAVGFLLLVRRLCGKSLPGLQSAVSGSGASMLKLFRGWCSRVSI